MRRPNGRWACSTPEQLRRLSELRPSGERHDVQLNHGSIRDPVWEYVIDDRTAAICIEHQTSALGMVGHSHVPLAYGYADGTFIGGLAPAGTEMVVKPGPFLLNPGSVGQPRDGDPRAAYLTVELETGHRSLAAGRLRHRRRAAGDQGRRPSDAGSDRAWPRATEPGRPVGACRPRPVWNPSRVSSATTVSRAL